MHEPTKMDCSEVQELLSSYFDDELASDTRKAVADHVGSCADCKGELSRFEVLSSLARGLDVASPAQRIWSQLEPQLDRESSEHEVRPRRAVLWFRTRIGQVAMAATIVVAAVLVWAGYSAWFQADEHDGFAAEFSQYLEEFRANPDGAQQFLLAKYEGQTVDAEQAVGLVGYRPAIADGLPQGYSVTSTYVMKMPCCTCVQCLCNRGDGSTIVIFEHDDEETTEWFGDRPELTVDCNGTRCRVVELDDALAASWKSDNGHITVVGIRDVAELTRLVAWLEERKEPGKDG